MNESSDDDVLARPISDLHLTERARRALRRLDAYRIRDVVARTEDDIKSLHNVGETTLGEIRSKLKQFGLALHGEGPEMAKPSPKPATHHDKSRVKIGDVVVPIARIVKFKRWENGVVVHIDNGERIDVYSVEANKLWANLTDPAGCVDLTTKT